MRIVIDHDFDDKGNIIADHVIHTDLWAFRRLWS